MDGTEFAALVQAGEQLFAVKLLLTSIQCLWIYDYLLTLGDEVRYAWSRNNPWVLFLFLANRYTPLVHLIWVHVNMFDYKLPFCQATKWVPIFHAGAVTVFAHLAIALRVYAITGKNKYLGGVLALVVVAEFCSDIFSIIWLGLGPLEALPEIDLDPFKICIYKRWRVGEFLYNSLAMFFELLSFLIVVITARKARKDRYRTMPSILEIILRDATHYFILIFSAQILSTLFLYCAPVDLQLMPGMVNTIFIPVMASRLMLSLRRAGANPEGVAHHESLTNTSRGRLGDEEMIRSGTRVPRPHEKRLSSTVPFSGDIELDVVLRQPQNRGSPQVIG